MNVPVAIHSLNERLEHARSCRFSDSRRSSRDNSIPIPTHIHTFARNEVLLHAETYTHPVTLDEITRREMIVGGMAASIQQRTQESSPVRPDNGGDLPMITCFIRYQIDPFQREEFKAYAEAWGRIIPHCGNHLVGYFLPSEGTNDVGWGLIAFENLSAYEAYRARVRADPEGRANFAAAQSKRFILREERTFLEIVNGTFEILPASPRKA